MARRTPKPSYADLFGWIYGHARGWLMLQRNPTEILYRASWHLEQHRPQLEGEELKLHLVTQMFISAIALESEGDSYENKLARTLKRAVLDYLAGNFVDFQDWEFRRRG